MNNLKRKIFQRFFPALLCTLCLSGFSACQNDLKPWNGQLATTAALSFYALSETFPYYVADPQVSQMSGIGIFTDTTEYQTIIRGALSSIPNFGFNPGYKEYAYPEIIGNSYGNQPLYMNFSAGRHRFVYSYFGYANPSAETFICNLPSARLADASFSFEAGSHSCLYLCDDLAAEGDTARYRVVKADQVVEGSIPAGKLSIRFINLSPDAGNISASLLQGDGSSMTTGLPQGLAFTGVSAYIAVDTAGAVQNKTLQLRITPDNGSPITVNIAAATSIGHCFDLVCFGFTQRHTRKIVNFVAQDGTPTYSDVQLPIGFKATLRENY